MTAATPPKGRGPLARREARLAWGLLLPGEIPTKDLSECFRAPDAPVPRVRAGPAEGVLEVLNMPLTEAEQEAIRRSAATLAEVQSKIVFVEDRQ